MSQVKKDKTHTSYSSEAAKWRHLVTRYVKGNVVEIASGGDPVVPDCVQIELPPKEYAVYNSNQAPRGPIQWRSKTALTDLPFKDGTVGTVIASHILEDTLDWAPSLIEWTRVLEPGGRLIICIPDKKRWQQALANGQPPNCSHRHEGYVGELSQYAADLGLSVICDKFTDCPPGDYNILFVAEKL